MSQFLEAALAYADKGLNVIPVQPNSNKPFLEDWPNVATTNRYQIIEWWTKNPDYNVAVVTGKRNGLLVLDLDLDEVKGKYGYQFAEDWQREHGRFPDDTWMAKTAHGGYHIYFKSDQPQNSPTGLFYDESGVDVRADGACVVVPPSVRDGLRYEWEQSPDEFDLRPANDAVRQFIKDGISEKAKQVDDGDADGERFTMPDEIPEGERTYTLVQMIGSMRDKGYSEGAIRAAVEAENEERCNPPLTEKELESEVFPALKRDWPASHPYAGQMHEEVKKLSFIGADELIKMELEATIFVVDEMIPAGLSIVASPPKYGKSWLVLDMCASVAAGSDFLGHHTKQSDVLYLALEDSNNRLQDRIGKVLDGRRPPQGLAMSTEAADLAHGLISQLTDFIEERPGTRLIVIDTFEKVRADVKRGESAYSADYREAGELKAFADQNKIALVLVHHTRKVRDFSDSFNNISGTHGLTGAADTMLVMEKDNRTDKGTKLSITGRDVTTDEFQMNFRDYRWRIIGTVDEVAEREREAKYYNSPIVQTIKKLMQQHGDGWTGTASELISASKDFHTPIFGSAQSVGRQVDKIAELLYRNDRIIFEPIKNGTGSRRYKFRYEVSPCEDEADI